MPGCVSVTLAWPAPSVVPPPTLAPGTALFVSPSDTLTVNGTPTLTAAGPFSWSRRGLLKKAYAQRTSRPGLNAAWQPPTWSAWKFTATPQEGNGGPLPLTSEPTRLTKKSPPAGVD